MIICKIFLGNERRDLLNIKRTYNSDVFFMSTIHQSLEKEGFFELFKINLQIMTGILVILLF